MPPHLTKSPNNYTSVAFDAHILLLIVIEGNDKTKDV